METKRLIASNITKRVFSFLLAMLILVSLVPVSADAAGDLPEGKTITVLGTAGNNVVGITETGISLEVENWTAGEVVVSVGLIPWNSTAPQTNSEAESGFVYMGDISTQNMLPDGTTYSITVGGVSNSEAVGKDFRVVLFVPYGDSECVYYGTSTVSVKSGSGDPETPEDTRNISASTLTVPEEATVKLKTSMTLKLIPNETINLGVNDVIEISSPVNFNMATLPSGYTLREKSYGWIRFSVTSPQTLTTSGLEIVINGIESYTADVNDSKVKLSCENKIALTKNFSQLTFLNGTNPNYTVEVSLPANTSGKLHFDENGNRTGDAFVINVAVKNSSGQTATNVNGSVRFGLNTYMGELDPDACTAVIQNGEASFEITSAKVSSRNIEMFYSVIRVWAYIDGESNAPATMAYTESPLLGWGFDLDKWVIAGEVTDATGTPLPGISMSVVFPGTGAMTFGTDAQGRYNAFIPDEILNKNFQPINATIQISANPNMEYLFWVQNRFCTYFTGYRPDLEIFTSDITLANKTTIFDIICLDTDGFVFAPDIRACDIGGVETRLVAGPNKNETDYDYTYWFEDGNGERLTNVAKTYSSATLSEPVTILADGRSSLYSDVLTNANGQVYVCFKLSRFPYTEWREALDKNYAAAVFEYKKVLYDETGIHLTADDPAGLCGGLYDENGLLLKRFDLNDGQVFSHYYTVADFAPNRKFYALALPRDWGGMIPETLEQAKLPGSFGNSYTLLDIIPESATNVPAEEPRLKHYEHTLSLPSTVFEIPVKTALSVARIDGDLVTLKADFTFADIDYILGLQSGLSISLFLPNSVSLESDMYAMSTLKTGDGRIWNFPTMLDMKEIGQTGEIRIEPALNIISWDNNAFRYLTSDGNSLYFTVKVEDATATHNLSVRFNATNRLADHAVGTISFTMPQTLRLIAPSYSARVVDVNGYAAPNTAVKLYIDGVESAITATANLAGRWSASLDLLEHKNPEEDWKELFTGRRFAIQAKSGSAESQEYYVALQEDMPQILTVTESVRNTEGHIVGTRTVMDRSRVAMDDGSGNTYYVWVDSKAGKNPQWPDDVANYSVWRPGDELNYTITTTDNSGIWAMKLYILDALGGEPFAMNAVYDSNRNLWVAKGITPGGNFSPGKYYVEYLPAQSFNETGAEGYAQGLDLLANTTYQLAAGLPETGVTPEMLAEDAAAAMHMRDQLLSELPPEISAMLTQNITTNPDGTINAVCETDSGDINFSNAMIKDVTGSEKDSLILRAQTSGKMIYAANLGYYNETYVSYTDTTGVARKYTYAEFVNAAGELNMKNVAVNGVCSYEDIFTALGIGPNTVVRFESFDVFDMNASASTSMRLMSNESLDTFVTGVDLTGTGLSAIANEFGETGIIISQEGSMVTKIAPQNFDVMGKIGGALGKLTGVSDIANCVNNITDVKVAMDTWHAEINEFISLKNDPRFDLLDFNTQNLHHDIVMSQLDQLGSFAQARGISDFTNGFMALGKSLLAATPLSASVGKGLSRGESALSASDSLFGLFQGKELSSSVINGVNNGRGALADSESFFYKKMYQADQLNREQNNQNPLKTNGVTSDFNPSWTYDPAGFAWSGTEDNRLEGVTAELWIADNENGDNARFWSDASRYDQVNPQITGSDGCYAWDVPTGWWQVRLTKAGHKAAESAWLPVLPIQLGVNLEMVPNGTGGNNGGGGVIAPNPSEPPEDDKPEYQNPFKDVSESNWFYEGVMYAAKNGLMIGTSTGDFSPEKSLTRGEIVTILYRYAGSPNVDGYNNSFTDVASGQYYTDPIKWAAAKGIVKGIGDNLFAPNVPVSRQDLVVILSNFLKSKGIALTSKREYMNFKDEANISDYAKAAVKSFYEGAIVEGRDTGVFDPKGTTTRAETAVMLQRLILAVE